MSEEQLIRHCAPTLAGIKTGNLFSSRIESREKTILQIRELNRKLVPKGLRIIPLRFTSERALVYVYRPEDLRADLQRREVIDILMREGYSSAAEDECVMELMRRVNVQNEFPHEIGLFLSYPPEDVVGFIKNRGANSKLVGCWTVYGDAGRAKKLFGIYKHCTEHYENKWAQGAAIENLAVKNRRKH